MLDVCGLMAIDTSDAVVTVSNEELLAVPEVAVTLAVPVPWLCASPALLIVAVATVSEDQVAVPVRSCEPPSVKVPVAVNCCVVPSAMVGVAGVMASETTAAEVNASVVEPVREPEVAVMVALPWPPLVTKPCVVASLLIVATAGVSELHCTVLVMFCVLPSV